MLWGLPSKQTVNAVGGRLRACDVRPGHRLWTLRDGRTSQTVVTAVEAAKTRSVVDVTTDHATFAAGPDQLLSTPDGWTHARDATGTVVAWAHARKLCRERLSIVPGYQLGYLIGATCSDGTFVELSEVIGARFTPCTNGAASHLVVADSWPTRGTFRPEAHPVDLEESTWVGVGAVTERVPSRKPSVVYRFRLDPHPTFLVNGHLVRTPWPR
ncbi:hypothetical protein [Streptomyces katrae]|uniref:hypothetical protein n=1 Tax=Streptomyces katrae TaxID=68223 RepID=UPI001F376117|nr:hypothetical protein [Streptomyces katrae]